MKESASGDVDELVWPPSSDDLNAIDVVRMPADALELKTHGLPDLVAVHALAGADADTVRSAATQSCATADGPLQSGERGRSWTRLALYTVASGVVLLAMSPWRGRRWCPLTRLDVGQVRPRGRRAASQRWLRR